MAEIPPSHAEQIDTLIRQLLRSSPESVRAELNTSWTWESWRSIIDAGLQAVRDEALKDAIYHRDCRPNRRQAEAWRDDAKAMNDKWADEFAARQKAEAHAAALADRLTRIEKITERWKDTAAAISADNAGHRYLSREEKAYSDGKIRALFSCAEQLCLALLALPQDGEARP